MRAARAGDDVEVARLLTAGAEVNTHIFGKTALLLAAKEGHAKVVALLLAAAGEMTRENKGTSLLAAATRGHDAVVALLLAIPGGMSRSDKDGALASAHRAGHDVIVARLLRAGASPTDAAAMISSIVGILSGMGMYLFSNVANVADDWRLSITLLFTLVVAGITNLATRRSIAASDRRGRANAACIVEEIRQQYVDKLLNLDEVRAQVQNTLCGLIGPLPNNSVAVIDRFLETPTMRGDLLLAWAVSHNYSTDVKLQRAAEKAMADVVSEARQAAKQKREEERRTKAAEDEKDAITRAKERAKQSIANEQAAKEQAANISVVPKGQAAVADEKSIDDELGQTELSGALDKDQFGIFRATFDKLNGEVVAIRKRYSIESKEAKQGFQKKLFTLLRASPKGFYLTSEPELPRLGADIHRFLKTSNVPLELLLKRCSRDPSKQESAVQKIAEFELDVLRKMDKKEVPPGDIIFMSPRGIAMCPPIVGTAPRHLTAVNDGLLRNSVLREMREGAQVDEAAAADVAAAAVP